jgi:hypothetical protein
MNHLVKHLVTCRAVDIGLSYCKKLAFRLCERVARDVTEAIVAPLLAPVEKFLGIVFSVSIYSVAIFTVLVFTRAIPRRS